jgi:hypothetical protein
VTPEDLARRFHTEYERLAPEHGYETREETRSFDPASPKGRLMVAVCGRILDALTSEREPVAWAIHGNRRGSVTFTYDRREMEMHAAEGDADGHPMYTIVSFARVTAPPDREARDRLLSRMGYGADGAYLCPDCGESMSELMYGGRISWECDRSHGRTVYGESYLKGLHRGWQEALRGVSIAAPPDRPPTDAPPP